VVVLSACESGVSSKQDVFTGVAHALVRSGIPAVVAMRSSLSDVGATDLVRDFYGALRLDFDVVTAITEARRALYVDRLDWHVPVVYTLHADRETLEKAPGVREAPSKPAFQLSLGLRPSVTVQLEFPAPVLFTKRPEQVRLGAALLASSPQVVSVDGPPGSGKTAIAGDMACRAAQQYHGGVLGLDCRTTNTLDAILVRINEVLLEAWEAQVDLTQPWGRKALSSALGQRPFLIVLDNFESVLDQGGKELESIVGFLRDLPAPSKALVTSRDRLDLGQRVEVCTLEMWPFALLLARAGKRRGITGFDQDLCDRVGLVLADSSRANEMLTSEERRIFNEAHTKLGGLPFAAEIFMGLVAEGESIVELLMDLRPVHERMTDLLDLSFDRLSEGAREMLVLMSVFYKPVKRGAVRAVYNRDDWEILLEELVRSSLVTGNRYGLHPLVREYAESKGSDKSRLSKAHMRAAKYFLTADDADSLAAIDHFYIAEAWGDVVRTANTFAEQLFRSGLWRQASLRMEKAVHAARITGDWGGEIAALNHLGIFHRNLGEAEEAKEYFHQALERATSVGDRTAIGSTLRNLGNAHGILGELPEAAKCHTEGLRIARETGDRRAEGISLGNLGNVYGEMGQAARAMRCYEQALEISREGGDRSAEANDLSNLGTAHAELGEYEMAMDYFEQALEMAVETQDRRTESYALGNIGNAYVALGDAERAIQCHETARTISREIGDRHGETKSVINLGVAYRHLGNIQKAIEYYGQALEIAKQTAYRAGEGKALGNLGSAYAALGQVDKAIHCTGQALEIAREIGGRRSEGTHLDNLGQVCKEEGNHDRALACYLLAIEIGEATGDPRTAARQEKIAQLKEQSGEEEFARLMERVEPNKERIVEEMLQSIAQDRQEDAGA
jgi:tetratricopeptide (TPR) repeat protein